MICLVGTYPLQLLLFCFALSPHSEGRRLILWLQWTRSILMALTRGYLKQFPSTWFSSRDTHGNYIYVVWLRSEKTMHHQSLIRGLKEVNLSAIVSHLLSQPLQPRVVDVCRVWKVTVVLQTQYKSLLTFISQSVSPRNSTLSHQSFVSESVVVQIQLLKWRVCHDSITDWLNASIANATRA